MSLTPVDRKRTGSIRNHSGNTREPPARGAGREVVPDGGLPRRGTPGNHSPAPRSPEAPPFTLGTPRDWVILRAGAPLGEISCPDAHTATICAVFRFGADVTVRPR